MEIKILGWGYENIRRFNSLQLDLFHESANLPQVTLVMMRNGTGKTTTISLMRAILDGSATTWRPEIVRVFACFHSFQLDFGYKKTGVHF